MLTYCKHIHFCLPLHFSIYECKTIGTISRSKWNKWIFLDIGEGRGWKGWWWAHKLHKVKQIGRIKERCGENQASEKDVVKWGKLPNNERTNKSYILIGKSRLREFWNHKKRWKLPNVSIEKQRDV